MKCLLLSLTIVFLMTSCIQEDFPAEVQVTNDLNYNHDLDNNDNFSPDNGWLVYDTRTDEGGIAASARIEKVNIETKEKVVLYQIRDNQAWGPGAGAVSYSPVENAVVFIHGLPSVTEGNPYQQWRRTGVIVYESDKEHPVFMDARQITDPYLKGALRGGTHRHEWSGDGQWIGFTYNDAVLKQLEDATGQKHNLRTIGVSRKIKPVKVSPDHSGENISGEWFSVLVVKVTPDPRPGSAEISHAAGDSWVGQNGYLKPDGTRQLARAFIGTIKDNDGKNTDEVFVVDIPSDIEKQGDAGPLEGTDTSLPMPPEGAKQRRLTYTSESLYPGCTGIVRSSPDGSKLAYLAKDKKGFIQVFTVSPDGGEPVQLTNHAGNVEGSVRWHPDGERVTYVFNKSIYICRTGDGSFEGRSKQLTKPSDSAPLNLVWSHNGKTLAYNRPVVSGKGTTKQIFILYLQ